MSLGDRQRDAIVAALRAARRGLDARRLADAVALHPNTVRWHLGLLADQGIVESRPERRGRGRPAIVYRLTPDGAARDRDEYRLLATMLVAALAEAPDAEARAYETGVRWGRYLMETPDPGVRPDPAAAAVRAVDLLDQQGFAAASEGETICMRRCPFYALAETHPEVVCTLHHGILDGALREAGADVQVASLEPFVEPTLCVARLERAS